MERNRKERRKGGGEKERTSGFVLTWRKEGLWGTSPSLGEQSVPPSPGGNWQLLQRQVCISSLMAPGPVPEHEVIGDVPSTSQVTSGCTAV